MFNNSKLSTDVFIEQCINTIDRRYYRRYVLTNTLFIRLTYHFLSLDINDYSPTFKQSFVQLSIAENVPVGYEIPLESAIDHDFGIFSIQNYELHPMINNPFRLIKGTKPILKLNEPLDREKQTIYSLELIAVDGGLPPLSGQQRIEIIVTEYVREE